MNITERCCQCAKHLRQVVIDAIKSPPFCARCGGLILSFVPIFEPLINRSEPLAPIQTRDYQLDHYETDPPPNAPVNLATSAASGRIAAPFGLDEEQWSPPQTQKNTWSWASGYRRYEIE
jgi:hypothetical protein